MNTLKNIVPLLVLLACVLGSSAAFAEEQQHRIGVNLNSADAQTIAASIKGVGQQKAQAIVAYRQQYGEFTDFSQLENVKGIGAKLAQKISMQAHLMPVSAKQHDTNATN